jgi:hypothetical protein
LKPLPPATLLAIARGLNDLALAKWERAVRHDPEAMTRVALHADPRELRDDWNWPERTVADLLLWRQDREDDAERKREDDEAAAALRIDEPRGQR